MGDKWMTSGQSRLAARQNRTFEHRARQRAALQGAAPAARLLRPDLPTNSRQSHPLLRKPDILAAGGSYSTLADPMYRRGVVAAAPRRIREYNLLHREEQEQQQQTEEGTAAANQVLSKRPRRIRNAHASTRPILERLAPPQNQHLFRPLGTNNMRNGINPPLHTISASYNTHHHHQTTIPKAPLPPYAAYGGGEGLLTRMEQEVPPPSQFYQDALHNPYAEHGHNQVYQDVLPATTAVHNHYSDSSIPTTRDWSDPFDENYLMSSDYHSAASYNSHHDEYSGQRHPSEVFPPQQSLLSPRYDPNQSFGAAWSASPSAVPRLRGISRFHQPQHHSLSQYATAQQGASPLSQQGLFASRHGPAKQVAHPLPQQGLFASRREPAQQVAHPLPQQGLFASRFPPQPPIAAARDDLFPAPPPSSGIAPPRHQQTDEMAWFHEQSAPPPENDFVSDIQPSEPFAEHFVTPFPAPTTSQPNGVFLQQQELQPSPFPFDDDDFAQPFTQAQRGIARFQRKPPERTPAKRNQEAAATDAPEVAPLPSVVAPPGDTDTIKTAVQPAKDAASTAQVAALAQAASHASPLRPSDHRPPQDGIDNSANRPIAAFSTWKRPNATVPPPQRPSTTPARLTQATNPSKLPAPRQRPDDSFAAADASMMSQSRSHNNQAHDTSPTQSQEEPMRGHSIRFFNLGVEVDVSNRPVGGPGRPAVSSQPTLSSQRVSTSDSPDSQGLDLTGMQSLWGAS